MIKRGILLLAAFLGGCAQGIFYQPDRVVYETPAAAGLKFEEVRFVSDDGTRLSGWMIPSAKPASAHSAKGTVIHFHGNAQNMTAHWRFAGWLAQRGFNVFVFDYRGYGASEGSPDPKGVFEDSVAAIRHVRSRADVDPAKLLLFGQSLGGSNAIAAAGNGELAGVRAIAVEATFYSYSAIADDKLTGAGMLMNDDYSAEKFIARLAPVPLWLIHGSADQVIGHQHSERLFAIAQTPKSLTLIPGGAHIEAMTARFGNLYRDQLVEFFESAMRSR